MDYLRIGKATDLSGRDRKIYRLLEIMPGFFSWGTLIFLIIFSFLRPVWVAYFIIVFDVYWLLLVIFLGLYLLAAYKKLKKNLKVNWEYKCKELNFNSPEADNMSLVRTHGMKWDDIVHLVIFPTYNESIEVIRPSFQALIHDGYPTEKIIMVLAIEERGGKGIRERATIMKNEFSDKFREFLVVVHPDNIEGELKGKGANQAWAAKEVKKKIIDAQNIDYNKILVSVFDIDTVIIPGYFFRLTHKFLTVNNPYRASYQPVPVYHNNIWQASFFARVAASSNTFWQMMQQVRHEKLATYSSHSMTFKTLVDIGFWSTNMVSEDSRIFWHAFCYYNSDYRVEPLHFPVSMDVTMDETSWQTIKSLYKQQRRWGWGVENLPYLIFNAVKRWNKIDKSKMFSRIFVQIYGFHSWATNALIIGIIGWMPLLFGGDNFNATVLSGNLPAVTRALMSFAMIGLVLSAIVSTLLIPKKPKKYGVGKNIIMFFQWIILPFSIIFFGAFPGLEAQTRLMFGKYMGFWVTPKSRVK